MSETESKSEKGFVYILTNPAFRKDWVKIGMTTRPVDERIRDLDTTSIPLPFEVYATLRTSHWSKIEHHLHLMIDKLTPGKRIRSGREFFNLPPAKALELLSECASLFDEEDGIDLCYEKSSRKRVSRKASSSEFICSRKDAKATMRITAGGYTVLSGSSVSSPSKSFVGSASARLRESLESDGTISGGVFKRDYEFKSSSAAASVVCGSPASGNAEWKTSAGVTLGNFLKGK